MSFPFTYTGKIKCNGGSCSDTGAFYSDFLRRAGEKFAKAKAETVVFDNKLSFRIKRNMSMILRHSSSAFSVFFPHSLVSVSVC